MTLGLGDVGSILFIEHVHALADEERKAKIPSNNNNSVKFLSMKILSLILI